MSNPVQNTQHQETPGPEDDAHFSSIPEPADSGGVKDPGYTYKLKPVGFPCPHCGGPLKWEAIKKVNPALDWSISFLREASRQPICPKCGLIKGRDMPPGFRLKYYFTIVAACLIIFVIGFVFAYLQKGD